MKRRVSRLPLRIRLVAGFAVAMLVLLTGAGAFVYWRVEFALDRALDTELTQATSAITPLVGADGEVTSTQAADATGLAWQVLDERGVVLDSGGPAPDRPLLPAGDVHPGTRDVGALLPVSDHPYRVRLTALDDAAGARAAYLLVAVRRDHRDEALRELLAQLAIAGLAALAVASLVGYALARLALDPVERYRRRADEIAASGTPDLRLDVPRSRDDEVTRLGHTLNEMLVALSGSLDRERQFVTDASHELRTPLALLSSRIQLTRRRERTVQEHEAALDELAVDLARLTALTEQLLDLSRDEVPSEVADVAAVVDSVVDRSRSAEPARFAQVSVDEPAEPVPAAIDHHSLERIVTNLLDNALAHGSPPVAVRVRREGGRAVLEVRDAGAGMAPELLDAATRRFNRARPGAGLGLSIVEQLVAAAGGELRLCHRGHHASSGTPSGLPCAHDDAMTVTVILPEER
jgi:two-component system, OmpR family, sensor kinase